MHRVPVNVGRQQARGTMDSVHIVLHMGACRVRMCDIAVAKRTISITFTYLLTMFTSLLTILIYLYFVECFFNKTSAMNYFM